MSHSQEWRARTLTISPLSWSDLTRHICTKLRLQTHGGVYAWEFEKEGRVLRVREGARHHA